MIQSTISDLWHNAFMREHVVDDDRYYATFHAEYGLDGEDLQHTNRYLVVALHPGAGTVMFHMHVNPTGNGWLPDKPEMPARLFLEAHEEFVRWCSNQIDTHSR